MNKIFFWPTILIGLIFFTDQLSYFFLVLENLETYMYVVIFAICMVLFAISFFTFLKHCPQRLNKMELALVIIVLLSMVFISFIVREVSVFIVLTNYLGDLIFLLGVIGYFQSRHKINLSFILWGLSVFLWRGNLYNAMYLVAE